MTIDADGKIYTVNNSHDRYETWDFTTGFIAESASGIENTFASLATIGTDLANIDWGGGGHGILIPKDYGAGEVDYPVPDISKPYNLGMMSSNYLVIGIDVTNSKIMIGKYDSSFVKVWTTIVAAGGYSMTCAVAAYPF